ncbi:hypothetical protein LZC95_16125 [Pendulispora brunnea]|uniref:Uncharacterized protein n=1 Tax=Pendulispora brunnea TaxID=2905690 RepID=A0ABZ2KIG4_9BACT
MPLVRARCQACEKPLGDPPHFPISVACPTCGLTNSVPFGADGQPAHFDVAFDANRLFRWFASARVAMARGAVGVALGACSHCCSALVVSSRQAMSLPCPHCQTPVEGTAGALIIDQWPEPFMLVSAGSALQAEYRISVLEDRAGIAAGCAACGTPTPPNDPSVHCPRCKAVTWVERPGPSEDPTPRRVQLAVRIDGTRDGQSFRAVLPVIQGEQSLRRDIAHGSSVSSGSRLMGLTGVGCAILFAGSLLLCVLIGILVHVLT